MTKVISTINLKGGVGKTLITVALAEFLALEEDRKVLLIDLDPQTNATVCLMKEDPDWIGKDNAGETIAQLFKDKLEKTSRFDIKKAIVKKASNVGGGIPNLDLLPSSLRLIEIQDSIPLISALSNYGINPTAILKESISEIKKDYDYILIDCPPNLGLITLNGIYFSDYYLVPVIPDVLSTWGIPTITKRIELFNEQHNLKIKPLGIVISMFRGQSNLHQSKLDELRKLRQTPDKRYPGIFNTVIHLATNIAESAEFTKQPNTLKQKYGYGRAYDDFHSLTKEILKYV